MKIIARHKNWVIGATITESDDENYQGKYAYRRYTATIRGFRNWKIYQGEIKENMAEIIINKVEKIKDKIDNNNEEIFKHKGYFI